MYVYILVIFIGCCAIVFRNSITGYYRDLLKELAMTRHRINGMEDLW